jgi:hypothetical protein
VIGYKIGFLSIMKFSVKKSTKGIIALSILALYAILNIDELEIDLIRMSRRHLSKNLGGGKCQWTPPEPLQGENPLNHTTLIASYPGSGKRLTWRLLEALTGSITGDDWDLSESGMDVLTMKTSWPHPEGNFSWGAKMDQMILLVRNPMYAIPSYHTMRYELDFSNTWLSSFAKKNYTYTKRPNDEQWKQWRDAKFSTEVDRWCWFIDFWMQDGLRRNNTEGTGPTQDWHCFHNYLDCVPKEIIQYEKLVARNPNIGIAESEKIGAVLEQTENVNVIQYDARPCIYRQVIGRKEFYNTNRGPKASEKEFSHQQLNSMRAQLETLRDKYSVEPWTGSTIAITLVNILNGYISDVQAEYEKELRKFFAQ